MVDPIEGDDGPYLRLADAKVVLGQMTLAIIRVATLANTGSGQDYARREQAFKDVGESLQELIDKMLASGILVQGDEL